MHHPGSSLQAGSTLLYSNVTGMPLPLDKSNGGSGDEISSGNVSLLAGYPGSIKDNKMTYHVKSTELFECAK